MARISASVGRRGRNISSDVRTVQNLLNNHIGKLTPLRPLAVDGLCGEKTVSAIIVFQRRVVGMNSPDGRVDPGGRTLSRLNGRGGGGEEARRFHYPAGPQEGLIDVARPYVGAREASGNRMGNDPRMREIFEADWLQQDDGSTDGYPWCCAFVSMCVQKFVAAQGNLYRHVTPPRTAGVTDFRTRWAVREQCAVFPPGSADFSPHRGDVVVFTFSHIGIVDTVGSGSVTTIEGNTNQAGSREGTHVLNKTREFDRIRCFIRMPVPIAYDTTNNVCRLPEAAE